VADPSGTPPASTFVIRFWREGPGTAGRWRGRIEHLQSGQGISFLDLADTLAFIQSLGVMPVGPDGGRGQAFSQIPARLQPDAFP
jgi:hypothetical protein